MFPILRKNKQAPLTHEEMDSNFELCMFPPFLHIQDQKTQGTTGGTFTSGAWRTRDLNTVLTNTISGASLATNQITLPVGKYYVEASASAFRVNGHQMKIMDVTNSLDIIVSLSAHAAEASAVGTFAFSTGIIEVSGNVDIEMQHRCVTTRATNGFGNSANFTTEVYSDIRIWRIGEYVAP